jgi:hypothetical protein
MRREVDRARNTGGMRLGLPRVNIDAAHLELLCNMAEKSNGELEQLKARVAVLEDFAAFAQMVASRQLDPDYVPVHVAEDMTKILNMSREITGEDDYDNYESAWLLRQKADVIEQCMRDIHRLRSAFNLSEDETMGIKMAIQHCKGEVRNLRLAADEADKEQES